MMGLFQTEALVITAVTFVISLAFALFLTLKYLKVRSRSMLLWAAGIWVFALGVLLEIIFATGYYSPSLMVLYLFVATFLVELLGLGSIQLVGSKAVRNAYYLFAIVTTILFLDTLASPNLGNW